MWGYVNFLRDIFGVERCADRGKMKDFVQNSIIKTHKYVNGWYKGNQGPSIRNSSGYGLNAARRRPGGIRKKEGMECLLREREILTQHTPLAVKQV